MSSKDYIKELSEKEIKYIIEMLRIDDILYDPHLVIYINDLLKYYSIYKLYDMILPYAEDEKDKKELAMSLNTVFGKLDIDLEESIDSLCNRFDVKDVIEILELTTEEPELLGEIEAKRSKKIFKFINNLKCLFYENI